METLPRLTNVAGILLRRPILFPIQQRKMYKIHQNNRISEKNALKNYDYKLRNT